MAWNNAVVTNGGVALLQQVLGGKQLILDSAGGGSGTVDTAALIAQTALKNKVQTFNIANAIDVSGGKRISVLITNKELETAYDMQQLGIWAHIGTGAPALFAILQDDKGINIPSESEMPDFAANFYVIIDFSGSSNIQVSVNPQTLLSHADLDAAGGVASYESVQAHIADPIAHMTQAQKDQLAAAVPKTRKINNKALSSDISLNAADVNAVPTTRKVNGKPLSADITLSASDTGAVPVTRKVNSKTLSSDITLGASDVGAIPTSQKGAAGGVANYDDLADHEADTIAHMTQSQKNQLAAAVPNTRTVNGHALSADATLSASDVGAAPSSHTGETISTEAGVHGIRWYDGKLQAKDSAGNWSEVAAGNLNFSGNLIISVSAEDGGSISGTRVRVRNEQLGANYVQPLDALGQTTFRLLDNHTYYIVLLDYPSKYFGAAATAQITGGTTQELALTLKTSPDIVGWRENVATGEIEYTDGAADFQPMSMASGALDAGSWGQNWLCGMRPCLLKAGIVQYYLKKTADLTFDYTKQANDTASDITSGDDGDVMIEFPRVYYKFFDETDAQGTHWIGCKYSRTPVDDTWCCNAWLNKNGVPQEVMYMSAYDGEIYNNKLRSLSGVVPTVNQTIGTFRTAANSNGAGYEQQEWSKHIYVSSLLPMFFKGLDSQALVGRGVSSASGKINTGSLNSKPLFWGDQTGTSGVKFCGIENCWGNIWKFADGLITDGDGWHYKVFGPYNDAGSGYTGAGSVPSSLTATYIDSMAASNGFGMLPKTSSSDADTAKFHDYVWAENTSSIYFARTAGYWSSGANGGAFYLYVGNTASSAFDNLGGALSYTPV